MKNIKGLLGIGLGIAFVALFLGISSAFFSDCDFLYEMRFGEYLLQPALMNVGWIVASISFSVMFGLRFAMGFNWQNAIYFFVFGLLHSLCSFCLFFLQNLNFSFLIICVILVMYIISFLRVHSAYPRFFAINLVYFLWICLILAQNYFLLIFN